MPVKKRHFVTFAQSFHQCYGEVIGEASWNKDDDCYVVRYWCDPRGDPPRKPYTLADKVDCEDTKLPKGFVQVS